jgi:addiction module HigA family antidote
VARKKRRQKRLSNVHPGEVLVEEFLEPLGISQYRLAKEIGVPLTRIAAICNRRRAITADTALRLARFFGTSARFWMGLQHDFDIEEASLAQAKDLVRIKPYGKPLPRGAREFETRVSG